MKYYFEAITLFTPSYLIYAPYKVMITTGLAPRSRSGQETLLIGVNSKALSLQRWNPFEINP